MENKSNDHKENFAKFIFEHTMVKNYKMNFPWQSLKTVSNDHMAI